jgi:glycosyltransferase involved in cell wall biosynthesis
MSKPTALQVVLSRELAGTERHVIELARALRERGWRSLVVARCDASPDVRAAYAAAGELIALPRGPAPSLTPLLARLIRREHVDVVNGHLGNGSLAALGAARMAGVAAVSTVHFVEPRHSQARTALMQRPAYRLMLRRMDAIIAVSNAAGAATLAELGTGGPTIHVVHNGIGEIVPASPGDRGAARPAERVVLFAGRLTSEKRPALLIEAMARLPVPARLWIAERGPERERLRRLAQDLMPGRVDMLGFVADIDRLLRRADVLAVPSRAEGFGLVALEAMRAEVPVVGFRAGALPEVVDDGVTGLLVAEGDVAALAAALARITTDRRLAKRLGRAGRAAFETRFTAARMAQHTELVYEAACRYRRPAAISA